MLETCKRHMWMQRKSRWLKLLRALNLINLRINGHEVLMYDLILRYQFEGSFFRLNRF